MSSNATVIKKKKGINTTTLITIIVCAVVVLACVWFVGFKLGWWHVPTKASFTMKSYDQIEISEADVEISDDTIQTYLDNFQSHYATTETVTTGTVEDGDTVHITYVGEIDGEEFEGGTTDDDGADLTIGSGNYIDGFEDGLIDAEVGSTVELNLTFPDDYTNEDVAGKDVVFTVTIESKEVTDTPDFTDAFVKENSAEYTEYYFDEATQIDTVDAYREYIYNYLYDYHLEDALEDEIVELIEVKSYDEEMYNTIYDSTMTSLETYASYYGVDTATLASYYGYDDAETYCKEQAEYQLKITMVYEQIAKDLGITHTQEEVDQAIQDYIDENGYTDSYTVESFKEANGEAWLYTFENYQMNYEPVIEALKERVVFVAAEEETEAETESESAAE